MPSYLMRDIDDALWKRLKVKAAREGVSMRALLESLLLAAVSRPKPKALDVAPILEQQAPPVVRPKGR